MKYTPEERRVLNDLEYDAIGDQLSIDNWAGALIFSGITLFLVGVLYFVVRCIAYFVEYIF